MGKRWGAGLFVLLVLCSMTALVFVGWADSGDGCGRFKPNLSRLPKSSRVVQVVGEEHNQGDGCDSSDSIIRVVTAEGVETARLEADLISPLVKDGWKVQLDMLPLMAAKSHKRDLSVSIIDGAENARELKDHFGDGHWIFLGPDLKAKAEALAAAGKSVVVIAYWAEV
jgi:hypothetical protein